MDLTVSGLNLEAGFSASLLKLTAWFWPVGSLQPVAVMRTIVPTGPLEGWIATARDGLRRTMPLPGRKVDSGGPAGGVELLAQPAIRRASAGKKLRRATQVRCVTD
jgi:hypothetical protein